MRALFSALVTTLSLTAFAAPAQAQVPGTHYEETLGYVADTTITMDGETMALCTLSEASMIFTVAIWYEVKSYALAPNQCDSEYFYDFYEEDVVAALARGQITADVPRVPVLPDDQQMRNYLLLGGAALIFAIVMLYSLRMALGSGKRRRKVSPNQAEFNEAALAAMCTVARADGHIDAQEAQVIAAVSGQVVGFRPKVEQVIEMLHHAPSDFAQINFSAFGEGLSPKQKRAVMYGALRVAVADGTIQEEEHRIINSLASALDVGPDVIRNMLKDIANPKHIRRAGVSNENRYLAYHGRYENADGNFSAAREAGGAFGAIGGAFRGLRSFTDDLL